MPFLKFCLYMAFILCELTLLLLILLERPGLFSSSILFVLSLRKKFLHVCCAYLKHSCQLSLSCCINYITHTFLVFYKTSTIFMRLWYEIFESFPKHHCWEVLSPLVSLAQNLSVITFREWWIKLHNIYWERKVTKITALFLHRQGKHFRAIVVIVIIGR